MKTGVLLTAHGSPDSLDDMEAFLRHVMKGRAPSPELVREMKRRYAAFGGRSPLLDITKAQAAALEDKLGLPVRVGMRHWRPFIADTAAGMESEGIDRIIGISTAPHYSMAGVGYDHAALRESVRKAELRLVESWHLEPNLLDAWAGRVREAGAGPFLFTAHSVPVDTADPYRSQIRETIDGILERVGPVEWDFAWQSRPMAPGMWTEPDVEAVLRRCGWKSVVVVPVGFVSDHAEILYDIDHRYRAVAGELGMSFRRTRMLNDSSLLIEALADVARKLL